MTVPPFTLGTLLAIIVILLAAVFMVLGQLSIVVGCLFLALAIARLA